MSCYLGRCSPGSESKTQRDSKRIHDNVLPAAVPPFRMRIILTVSAIVATAQIERVVFKYHFNKFPHDTQAKDIEPILWIPVGKHEIETKVRNAPAVQKVVPWCRQVRVRQWIIKIGYFAPNRPVCDNDKGNEQANQEDGQICISHISYC